MCMCLRRVYVGCSVCSTRHALRCRRRRRHHSSSVPPSSSSSWSSEIASIESVGVRSGRLCSWLLLRDGGCPSASAAEPIEFRLLLRERDILNKQLVRQSRVVVAAVVHSSSSLQCPTRRELLQDLS